LTRAASLSAAAIIGVACSHSTPVTQVPSQPVAAAASAPASQATGTPIDQGVLTYTQAGTNVGTEVFSVSSIAGGTAYESAGKLMDGTKFALKEVVDAKGRPLSGSQAVDAGGTRVAVDIQRSQSGGFDVSSASGGPARTQHVDGDADLFLFQGASSITFAPLCGIPPLGADGKDLTAFPGIKVHVAEGPPARMKSGGKDKTGRTVVLVIPSGAIDVTCDGDRFVGVAVPLAGLTAIRGDYTVSTETRSKPPLAPGLSETDVTVHSDGAGGKQPADLACSLILPTPPATGPAIHAHKLPAVTFFTGSGPEDRDEDSPGDGGLKMSIFKVIAMKLGEEGIASLRCDDRGVAKSTGDATVATADTYVADAAAQVAFLRADPRIDGTRIGLIGHSEGAAVMPVVASHDPAIRAMVLMAAPGRPWEQILESQVEWALTSQGASQPDIDKAEAEEHELLESIRNNTPLPASAPSDLKKSVQTLGPWLRSWMAYDPAKVIAQVGANTSVLLCQGDKDVQVSVQDQKVLSDALSAAHHKDVVVKTYPGLNHLFCPVRLGGLADYSDPDAQIDPAFLADVAEFLKRTLTP
jgi:dienelactone hydrolase